MARQRSLSILTLGLITNLLTDGRNLRMSLLTTIQCNYFVNAICRRTPYRIISLYIVWKRTVSLNWRTVYTHTLVAWLFIHWLITILIYYFFLLAYTIKLQLKITCWHINGRNTISKCTLTFETLSTHLILFSKGHRDT